MKTLVLANAFKGSLSALEAGKEIQKYFPKSKLRLISDGGDGIIQVFAAANPKAKIFNARVSDAYGKPKSAPALILPGGKTAVLETAKICGLGGIAKKDLRPLISTSKGVGQMIKILAAKGVKTFYIGLGGVACNDGGAGMAGALGVRFLDVKGKVLPLTTKSLLDIAHIDTRGLNLRGLKFFALTDVTNPILGPNGSAAVYGPQKSKTLAEVNTIARALVNYVAVIKSDLGLDIALAPGTGAAGAIAAGMLVFLNAKFLPGADFIFEKMSLEREIKNADLVITTEGCLDRQTFMGKAPGMACALAKKHKKELLFICGKSKIKNHKKHGIYEVLELCKLAASEQDSISNAKKHISDICKIHTSN